MSGRCHGYVITCSDENIPSSNQEAFALEWLSPEPRKIEGAAGNRRREHDAGCGYAVRQQPLDHLLQLGDGRRRDLQEERIAAGDMMALLYLRQLFHKLQE